MGEALAVIGLGLTVPDLVRSCVQFYQFLSASLEDIRTTEAKLEPLTLLLDLSLSNLDETFGLVDKIESSLDPSAKLLLLRVLLQVKTLLVKFALKLDSCYERDGKSAKRFRFTFGLKSDLEKFKDDIDMWNERLAQRLLLRGVAIALEAKAQADGGTAEQGTIPAQSHQEIQARFLDATELPAAQTLRLVEGSNAFVGETPDGQTAVIEYRYFKRDASFQEKMFVKHSVRDVATMLCNAHSRLKFSGGDPISKGILECIGYFADESHTRYGLISKLPTTLNKAPKSLQSLLCNPENRKGSRHDLNDRVVLARSVASAVLAIHSAQFVHKSIRPSNILVFDPQEPGTRGYPYKLGRPVIVGFEQTRPDSDDTERRGTTAWEENIYRHPERQGLKPKQRYSMMHDIYSLGVIFTEIAFWRSSLAEVKDKETGVITTYHNPDFWGNLYETRRKEDDPEKIQSFYKKLAKSAVPKHIGGRFASLIESCLTCLEGGFGGAKDDDNDAVIGAAYIERVVESLEAICL